MISAINIIAFDVPYPPNYGGIIDVFYKLKTFHKKGIKVHLHCFEYGRGEQKELLKYCESVNYYKRNMSPLGVFSKLPFIIKSRVSSELKNNLLQNDYPILFEGLHTCFLLNDKAFKNRIKIFRESNIEHEYYEHLAKSEKNILKKLYLKTEVAKLKKFEAIVNHADLSFIVSEKDWEYFCTKYPNNNNHFVPSFHSGKDVTITKGKGEYVLYHGNLSVSENYEGARYILEKIFNDLTIPLIISGLNPPDFLKDLVSKYKHVSLISNPPEKEMKGLIANAQINFLYTHQPTGLKLKLLNVLYHGRFCVTNSHMVWGTTLAPICEIKDTPQELKQLITSLFKQDFSDEEKEKREKLLFENYSNNINLKRITDEIEKLTS
jgi:hypothetical protein